jgi:hypothetical protein
LATGSSIVDGCREAEISELAPQVAQELCGLGDRFERVELSAAPLPTAVDLMVQRKTTAAAYKPPRRKRRRQAR